MGNPCFSKACSLLSIEAKKSRGSARQPKEPAPEETNKSVFVVFLKEAGVTLRQGGTSNEIGKHKHFPKHIRPKVWMGFNYWSLFILFPYLFPFSSCRPSCFSKKDKAATTEESQVPWGKYIQHPYVVLY